MSLKQHTRCKPQARWQGLLVVLVVAGILAVLLAPPHGLLEKTDRAAFAVCHRIPDRTFTLAGRPLPLCARCSGTYLAALAGLAVLLLRGRGQANTLPAPKYLTVFGVFLVAWGVDGFNSFLTFFPGVVQLYEPHNLLRLVTGALVGLALAALVLPAFNLALWAEFPPSPSVGTWQDLACMLMGGLLVIGGVASGLPFLLYPLAVLSGLALVALLGTVNSIFVLLVLPRVGHMTGRRQAALPFLLGLALAVLELVVVGLARAALESRIRPPW